MLQPLIVFHSCHFVRHLGIYNGICEKTSTPNARCRYVQFAEKRSRYVNKWPSKTQYGSWTCDSSSLVVFRIRCELMLNSFAFIFVKR